MYHQHYQNDNNLSSMRRKKHWYHLMYNSNM